MFENEGMHEGNPSTCILACSPDSCEDNDSMIVPCDMGSYTDNDNDSSGSYTQGKYCEEDEDWYYFEVQDLTLPTVDPEVWLEGLDTDLDLMVCYRCIYGNPNSSFSCSSGGYVNYAGMHCCESWNGGNNSEHVHFGCLTCPSFCLDQTDDNIGVFVRVYPALSNDSTCDHRYTLRWHF